MYQDILKNSGLSEKEAQTYEKMLETGPASVGALLKVLPFKRGDMYNIMQGLCAKGLAREELKSGILTYTLEDPEKLPSLILAEQDKTKIALKQATDALPRLKSLYNLSLQRPGVRFYEGDAGIWKTLEDSLTSKTEIYSIGDIDSIVKYIPDINQRYAAKRNARKLKKRGLAIDTPLAREYLAKYYKYITDTKLIPLSSVDLFETVMQIYDSKVSYITLGKKTKIGVIIEDHVIYRMHKILFEYLWDVLPGIVV